MAELKLLRDDILDSSGAISNQYSNPETEAGMAYSRITAVYPEYAKDAKDAKDSLARATVENLMKHQEVAGVLGTTTKLRAQTAQDVFQQLQPYVDSSEKSDARSMAQWPLIRVVRIYTKAQALSTGAILVDLVSSSHPTALCCTFCHVLIAAARLPGLERGSGRCS